MTAFMILSKKNKINNSSSNDKLSERISISHLFRFTPELFEKDYGGDLIAYSFESISIDDWFMIFRQRLIDAIGNNYLPVYRMADGEFHFLLGERFDYHSTRHFIYLLKYLKHKVFEIILGPRINTLWGERYSSKDVLELRKKFIRDLNNLLETGILCAYLYENPRNAYVHYNLPFLKFADKHSLELNKFNLFPFHFPFFALSNDGWQDFISNKKILIVTGNLEKRKRILEKNIIELGSKKVGFLEISSNSSMKDKLNIDKIKDLQEYEIAFVAAGIGSLNIISQMKWFNGPVIDVGGFLSALENKDFIYHGGAVKFPHLNLRTE